MKYVAVAKSPYHQFVLFMQYYTRITLWLVFWKKKLTCYILLHAYSYKLRCWHECCPLNTNLPLYLKGKKAHHDVPETFQEGGGVNPRISASPVPYTNYENTVHKRYHGVKAFSVYSPSELGHPTHAFRI